VNSYVVSTDPGLLQLPRIHAFLSTQAYWCLGIPYETVAQAAANSLCFGVYRVRDAEELTKELRPAPNLVQVGFARVVTDSATFAWLCDVYVEDAHRGQGLSKRLMTEVMQHPQLQGLRRICLATRDAHSLYEQFGFTATKAPQNWLEIRNDAVYSKK
jgi:GNAT superfamily N-acetyltransferase